MTYKTLEEAQCLGKHPFPTHNLAQSSIRKHTVGAFEVFRCPHCGFYHVGHATPKKQNLKRFNSLKNFYQDPKK
jgi:hypothetical protein